MYVTSLTIMRNMIETKMYMGLKTRSHDTEGGDVRVGNGIENKEVCVKLILGSTNIKGGGSRSNRRWT